MLASEPLCLCGVDVAAPQTSRTTRRQTIAQLKDSFSAQLTPEEARYYGPIYADYLPADSFKGAPHLRQNLPALFMVTSLLVPLRLPVACA